MSAIFIAAILFVALAVLVVGGALNMASRSEEATEAEEPCDGRCGNPDCNLTVTGTEIKKDSDANR